jgi:NAD+ synthase
MEEKIFMNYDFDAEEQTKNVINWIKDWFFNESGGAAGAITGISGGCDSTVVACLCCEALGADRVRGVLMPNGVQLDIADARRVCGILGITYHEVNIEAAYGALKGAIEPEGLPLGAQADINIPPRLRMTAVYAVGQSLNYRVAGTGNLSERFVGYCTKWGMDTAHDFNPVANFTKTEVKQIGDVLGLPRELVHKTPADGLSGLSDEENMKISYGVLDSFIRTGTYDEKNEEIKEMIKRIEKRREINAHKQKPIPCYPFGGYKFL